MSDGVIVSDDCKRAYEELKNDQRYRYIICIIKDEHIIDVEKTGDWDAGYDQYLEDLQVDDEIKCRYSVFDFKGMGVVEDDQESLLVLISWSPDKAKVKYKAMYSSYYSIFKQTLGGIQREVQVFLKKDLDFENLKQLL